MPSSTSTPKVVSISSPRRAGNASPAETHRRKLEQSRNDRNAEENCGLVYGKHAADNFRVRLLTTENRRAAVEQREAKCIAKAIGEGQTRGRKHAITRTKLQNFTTIRFIGVEDVRFAMNGPFRFAGAAGSVKDESRLIRGRK